MAANRHTPRNKGFAVISAAASFQLTGRSRSVERLRCMKWDGIRHIKRFDSLFEACTSSARLENVYALDVDY